MLKEMSILRFGEFTLDRYARELRRQDILLPVSGKAFELLSYMVANAGRPLPKSELLDAVWPETSVEESNLSQNVFLLRKVLGSGSDGPIKTLPGRGYQFTAPVSELQASQSSVSSHSPAVDSGPSMALQSTHTRVIVEDEIEEHVSRAWLPILVASLVVIVGAIVVFSGGWLVYRHAQQGAVASPGIVNPSGRRAVAVLGFRNISSHPEDAWLSTAVAEMLASEMSAGDKLRVIPTEEIARVESDLGMNAHGVDIASSRASLQKATGADMLVQGSYVVVGHEAKPAVRLMVQVEDAHSGKQLASFSETGEIGGLFALVDQAGTEIRKDLSDQSTDKEDEQALASMSQSTDAMRFYAEGVDQERHFDDHGARNLFERAVLADPRFAMAHLGLAEAWSNLGYEERAAKESAEAFKLSANLPKAQRLAIEADYRDRSNDSDQAINIYRALSTFYPDDERWGIKLASEQFYNGHLKDAVDTLERTRKLPLTPSETVELDGFEAAAYSHIDEPQANDKARALADEAIALADKQGGLLVHGRAYRAKCFVLSHIGPVAAGRAACEQAKDIFQAAGNLLAVAAAINNLGVLSQQAGNWEQAEAEYQTAGNQYHQLGSFGLEVDEIQNLAHLALSRGDLAKAIKGARQLSQTTGTSDDFHTAYTGHLYTAIALLQSGQLHDARAEVLKAQLDADKEQKSDYRVYHQARTRNLMGWIALGEGNLGEAQKLFAESLSIVKPTHDDSGEALFTLAQADVVLMQGQPGREVLEGVRHSAAVLCKLQDQSDGCIEAKVLLAQLDCKTGGLVEASQSIAEAKTLDSKGDSFDTHLTFLVGDAEVQAALGHADQAEKILEQEVNVANAKGYPYYGLEGEIQLARLERKTAASPQAATRLQTLSHQAERAGFKGLAREALAPQA